MPYDKRLDDIRKNQPSGMQAMIDDMNKDKQIADLKAQVAELIEAADHVCQVSGRTGIVRLREAVAKAGGE